MKNKVQIAIVGDWNPAWSHHVKLDESLQHAAVQIAVSLDARWIPTDSLSAGGTGLLDEFDGIWCASGSPFKSMEGALSAIRYARDRKKPFFGT